MEIRSVSTMAQGPQGLDALGATAAPPPTATETVSNVLDPPVKLDIGTGGHEARFVRDRDSSAMVFQVVDPTSGDVVAQLPSETALRNRAYESARAQRTDSGGLSRVA